MNLLTLLALDHMIYRSQDKASTLDKFTDSLLFNVLGWISLLGIAFGIVAAIVSTIGMENAIFGSVFPGIMITSYYLTKRADKTRATAAAAAEH